MEIKDAKIIMYAQGIDIDKQKEYEEHVYTEKELKILDAMKTKINVYFKISRDLDNAIKYDDAIYSYLIDGLTYIEGKGYIKITRFDDIVSVVCFGEKDEETFVNMVRCYEYMCGYFNALEDSMGENELSKLYNERFPESKSINHDNHNNFFAAEHVIRSFRKYYGCGLPTPLVNHYENVASTAEGEDFEYSYKDRGFVLRKKLN